MQRRGSWATRYGFYLAAVGSAFGLGNLWRFPYVAGNNGGGAFVVLYLFCALLVGLPLLVAELVLGKTTRRSVVAAMAQVGQGRKIWIGWGYLTVIASLAVLSYYAVVSGWVLHFLSRYVMALVHATTTVDSGTYDRLMNNGTLQLLLTSAHLLLTALVVAKGVKDGIERWIRFIMPVFFVLMVLLVIQGLFLPSAADALRFLLYPDFSRLTTSSLGQALGHVFFTLSLGFGMMIVFGSYMQDDIHLPGAGFRVAIIDLTVSLAAAFMIFVMAFSAENAGHEIGPQMLFEAAPLLFARVPWGELWGVVFFACLYAASLGASMGLLEAAVANLIDRHRVRRSRAAWLMGLVTFVIAIFPALSSTAFSDVRIQGLSLLALFDTALINWILPILGLGVSLLVGYVMKESVLRREFVEETAHSSVILYPRWIFILRFGVPAVVVAALVIQIVGLFF